MSAYYNENDLKTAAWLRELIKAKLIADGEVDTRSIVEVQSSDLAGFVQCHFFAGIGGWSYALRLAGWSDDRAAWTGSCPCQAFSAATRGRQVAADMWPEFRRLIISSRPRIVFGEQVPHARKWFDGVCTDLEAVGYAIGAAVLSPLGVGQDHIRPRIYFACHTDSNRKPELPINAKVAGMQKYRDDTGDVVSTDGISDRLALAGFGNAIVPQVAAEVIAAYMEICNEREANP